MIEPVYFLTIKSGPAITIMALYTIITITDLLFFEILQTASDATTCQH